ncbi:VOC family protein [Bordetella genomosp. 11]|uniref:Glyoxalase n=1 Tax=Bordetella genomosp. 11 TaxID=1416808 RepID=A0A261UES2_9BORD|nr:VOC family protein [Bordetella genomosp. 11]OZI60446.1 glyoxalase [Bordetella genomosp. 11]
MSKPTSHPIPPGMHTLTPHLVCANALRAIEFYEKAFGAKLENKLMSPDGKMLMHAMLRIGDSALMLAEECPEWGSLGPQDGQPKSMVIHLYVTDVDATVERAVAAGAKVVMPVTDMFWGDRYGQIDDPSGHRWSVATHKVDVAPEEMQEAMAKMPPGR